MGVGKDTTQKSYKDVQLENWDGRDPEIWLSYSIQYINGCEEKYANKFNQGRPGGILGWEGSRDLVGVLNSKPEWM